MEGELINTQEGLEGELGYKGDRGYSAYEIAVKNGYEGTEQDWIDHFGLDLTDYLKTTDVVNSTDSDSTTKPLSAAKGKQLQQWVNMLYTDKADLTDLAYYESKGTVLWTNPDAQESLSALTIQLSTDDYDVIDVYGTAGDSFVTLIKYPTTHTTSGWARTNTNIWSNDRSVHRKIDWSQNVITIFDAKESDNTTVHNTLCIPVAIVGRKLGLFTNNGGN